MDIEKVEEFAKNHLKKNDITHGWYHAQRVRRISKKLGKRKGADLKVLEIAALLHDIGIHKDREDHEIRSAELAKKILADYEKKEEVIHCIKTHRFSKNKNPKTLEAKILQDADKLDAIGAIGIMRTAHHSGKFNKPLYNPDGENMRGNKSVNETTIDHFYEKLLKIKNNLNTETAKKIAVRRHVFMEDFLEEFFKEWNGKR